MSLEPQGGGLDGNSSSGNSDLFLVKYESDGNKYNMFQSVSNISICDQSPETDLLD